MHPKAEYVLGIDPAGMGADSCVYIVIEKPWGSEIHYVVYMLEQPYTTPMQIVKTALWLNSKFKFRKIMVDETGGQAVANVCQETVGMRAEGIIFSEKSKVEMYNNLKMYMERGLLKLPMAKNNSPADKYNKLRNQLADMRYELKDSGKLFKIHHSDGGHDDFADSLALAMYHYKVRQTNAAGRLYVG